MPAIALNTAENSLLAFLLIAGNEALEEGSTIRQCILTCPPADPKDVDHPISIARTEHLHAEHKANVYETNQGVDMFVSISSGAHLAITLPKDGDGRWALGGAFGDAVGVCRIAISKATKTGEQDAAVKGRE